MLSTRARRIGARTRYRIPPVSLNLYFVALIAVVTSVERARDLLQQAGLV